MSHRTSGSRHVRIKLRSGTLSIAIQMSQRHGQPNYLVEVQMHICEVGYKQLRRLFTTTTSTCTIALLQF
uniref:Uncharacterized protein n=1 Tax=Syphacia muris TaxID=451379 RepID=A0A0N5AHJ6_9BILA